MNLDNFEIDRGVTPKELAAMRYLIKIRPDKYSLMARTFKGENVTFVKFSGDKLYQTFYVKMKPFKWQENN